LRPLPRCWPRASVFVVYDRHARQRELDAIALERDKARARGRITSRNSSPRPRPAKVREGKLTARELLAQRSVARLAEGDTATMPNDARAAMYLRRGQGLGNQQLRDEASTMYERAITLWRREPRPPVEDLTVALNGPRRAGLISAAT
jgi:hypothetical protein